MTEKYSDYFNPVLSLSREKGLHPSAWFGGRGGVSGERRRGCRGGEISGPRGARAAGSAQALDGWRLKSDEWAVKFQIESDFGNI